MRCVRGVGGGGTKNSNPLSGGQLDLSVSPEASWNISLASCSCYVGTDETFKRWNRESTDWCVGLLGVFAVSLCASHMR